MTDQNQILENSIKNLLIELGLTDLSEEKKQDYIEKIKQILEARVYMRISEELSNEDVEKLNQMSDEETITFFESKNIDVPKITIEEAMLVREELKSNMDYSQGLIDQMAEEQRTNNSDQS